MPISQREIVQFEVDGQDYGIDARTVEQVCPSLVPVRLPKTPEIVEGVVNLRGTMVPVLDIRARYRLQPKPVEAGDFLIVAEAGGRRVAIRADRVSGLVKFAPHELHAAKAVFPTENHISDIASHPGGVVLLPDLGAFLTGAEEEMLAAALKDAPPARGAPA